MKLKEISNITMGSSPKSINILDDPKCIPFLQGNRTFNSVYPDIDKYTDKVTKIAKKGSILFSVRAPVGDINIAPCDCCIGRGIASIEAKNCNRDYLFYWLKKYNFDTINRTSGTIYGSVNRTFLENLEIKDITIEEQKEIADRISVYDDKIENNNKIINILEEMASLLYKRYFIDFEFPNDEDKPYKSSGGQFIDSEVGQIPIDTKNIKAEELMEFITGFEPGAKSYVENKVSDEYVQFFRVKDLNEKQEIYINKDIIKKNNNVTKNDVLVSFDATIGRVAIGYEGCYSSGMKKIVPLNECISTAFIYFYMKNEKTQNILKEHATGTTILHASKSIDYLNVIFSSEILKKFNSKVIPIYEMILNKKEENEILVETRDLLIQELIK